MNIETYNLGDFQITTAATQTGTIISNLDELSTLTISARFQMGSGGATVIARIQTSLNQGSTWIDIARFDFDTVGLEKIYNLTNHSTVTLPASIDSNNDVTIISPYTVVSLDAEGAINGILGDRLRAVVTSTGTYTGSTVLSIRAPVRAT
jgi:hypothetical protein